MFLLKLKIKSYLKILFLTAAFAIAIVCFCVSQYSLYFNVSDSIPKGLYILDKRMPKKNDYALFCLRGEFTELAKERKYLSNGVCNGLAPIGKRVVAKEGDFIKINRFGTYVQNERLKRSAPLQFDSKGNIMPQRYLSKVLKEGEYLLIAKKIYSFDSRYFGIVTKNDILGTIRPVFTYEKGHLNM